MTYQIHEPQMRDLETLSVDMKNACNSEITDLNVASILMHSYANRLDLITKKINNNNVVLGKLNI